MNLSESMPADTAAGPIAALVDAARRRLLTYNGVRDGLWAAAIALAGPALLFALGVDAFPAFLLLVFLLGGIVWGFYHWRRSTPDEYRVAQLLDSRSGSEDQISTAWFFARQPQAPAAAGLQREIAQRAARSVDVGAALPFAWPKATWWAAGMLALSLSLLGLRIALQPKLDLKPPLAPMLFPGLVGFTEQPVELGPSERAESQDEPFSLDRQGETEEPQPEDEGAHDTLQVPVGEERAEAFEMPEVEGLSAGEEIGDDMAADNMGDGEQGDESTPGEKGAETGNEQASNEDDAASDWSEESNNLLDRLKDAFKDMMDNMGMEPPQTAQGEEGQEQQGQGEQASEGQQGQQAQAEAGAQASDAEMEGGEPGEGEPQQTAQGQGSSDTNEAGQQGEAASASGAAEGSKELAEAMAEQQAAMDALEEFYMKRAEEIQGEIMVETTETEQTAQTPYRDIAGRHADRGGAVSRDEIPLAYRRYIENYFRNLRAKDQN